MNNIIDLEKERSARERPDDAHIRRDEYGRELYRFGFDFDHSDGKNYSFHFWAYDSVDAEEKMNSIRKNGRVFGQIFSIISI